MMQSCTLAFGGIFWCKLILGCLFVRSSILLGFLKTSNFQGELFAKGELASLGSLKRQKLASLVSLRSAINKGSPSHLRDFFQQFEDRSLCREFQLQTSQGFEDLEAWVLRSRPYSTYQSLHRCRRHQRLAKSCCYRLFQD